MLRLLNVLAVAGLVGTAMWAYSIKYDTIYYAEQVKKLERRLDRERDAISVLRAEWQHINRPVRLQILADRHLQLQSLQATQIARAGDIPARPQTEDLLASKFDQLMTGSIPAAGAKPAARPAAQR